MNEKLIRKHTELEVYEKAFSFAMRVFEVTKSFPKEERYSLTDQVRRSSRSVCANIAEAWRKRRYEGSFISKLSELWTFLCRDLAGPLRECEQHISICLHVCTQPLHIISFR